MVLLLNPNRCLTSNDRFFVGLQDFGVIKFATYV